MDKRTSEWDKGSGARVFVLYTPNNNPVVGLIRGPWPDHVADGWNACFIVVLW